MTIEQFEKAKAIRYDIDKLKSIFKDKRWNEKPCSELNIGFEIRDGVVSKSINIPVPQYLAENILGLINKRILQLIDLSEEDFKKI